MVTSEHMNQLLKNVLNLIKSHVGVEMAPWMTRIAGFTQQIIINTSEELLKDPFLPLAQKIRKRTEQMFHKEEALRGFLKSTVEDTSQVCNHQSIIEIVKNTLVFLNTKIRDSWEISSPIKILREFLNILEIWK